MELLFKVVFFYLCIQVTVSSKTTYKVGVGTGSLKDGVNDFCPLISESSNQNADIVLLSMAVTDFETLSETGCGPDNYDQLVREISAAAKKFGVYIVTHLYEKIRCRNSEELVRSNLVFDRKGAVVAVYRKPHNNFALCNATLIKMAAFTTDFGVNFLVLMDEDIVLQDLRSFNNTKNFIVTGGSSADMAYLRGNQLLSSWAYASNANVVSDSGVYAGRAGLKTGAGPVVELNKNGGEDRFKTLSLSPLNLRDLPAEDMSQHTIRPLDLEASIHGYEEVVCQGKFCCEFYVKTKIIGAEANDAHYSLAVFDGSRQMGAHYIGVESCKVVVCAALYKRSCVLGLENNFNVVFENISIKGNFTKHRSTQLPVILTTETSLSSDKFVFYAKPVKDVQEVTILMSDANNILKFGILGRDYSKDFQENLNCNSNHTNSKLQEFGDFYEFIFNEDVIEFFDYLWIRVRVVILIVSIYILEMM